MCVLTCSALAAHKCLLSTMMRSTCDRFRQCMASFNRLGLTGAVSALCRPKANWKLNLIQVRVGVLAFESESESRSSLHCRSRKQVLTRILYTNEIVFSRSLLQIFNSTTSKERILAWNPSTHLPYFTPYGISTTSSSLKLDRWHEIYIAFR